MKSILICSTSYPANNATDGKEAAGAFVAEFAHNLSNEYEVMVVAPGLRNSEESNGNVTVCRFKVDSLPLSLLSLKNPGDWSRILKTLYYGNQKVKEQAQKTAPEHIFAFWALPTGYWAKRASRSLGIPFSIWCLGSDIWTLGKIPGVRTILQRTLRSANQTFADGLELCNQVEALSNRKCNFLPSSRSLKGTRPKTLSSNSPYKLAFLGRWHENKGIDILLDSLEILSAEDWTRIAEVRICGGGPMEELVKEKYEKLRGKKLPIKLEGFKDEQGAIELFEWADYVIIPSRIESIPVVFSDAMQLSCPVISTPVGDLPDLISRYNVGITAREPDSNSLAEAISNALCTPPDNYIGLLDKAAEDFNSATCVRKFISAIQ